MPAGELILGDEATYLRGARILAEQGRFEDWEFVRPPGYFAFLAAFALSFEGWVRAAKVAQCVLGTLAALPAFLVARRVVGPRAALASAAFVLFDPTLIAYCHMLWPETVYLLLVSAVFACGLPTGLTGAAALGALSGACMLFKPVFGLYPLCLAAGWLLALPAAQAARRVAAFALVAAALLAPWVLRNQLLYGPGVLIDNTASYNLWIANDPRPPMGVLDEWVALPADPALRARVARQRAWAAISAEPARFAAHWATRVANLWGPEYFVLRNAIFGSYGEVERATVVALFWTLNLPWIATLALAAAGARRAWRHPELRLLLAHAALFTGVVATLFTSTRFRMPFALPLAVCAGIASSALAQRRLERRDWLAGLGVAALLLLSAARPPFASIASGDFSSVAELRRIGWFFFRY